MSSLIGRGKIASLGEMCWIALPLMITGLSNNLMMFVDRIFLAQYSLKSMAAVVMAGTICTAFQLPTIAIAAISEVFVGRYHGAQQPSQIGKVVWQMIWFSIGTLLFYIPLGLYGGPFFFSAEYAKYGIPYFSTIMFFGPIFPLIAALSAFYIGRKKVKLVTFTAMLGNLFNVLFAYAFIFGVPHWIPPMGTFGAALATGCAMIIQASILLITFLQPKFHHLYKTWSIQFSSKDFMACLKVGFPSAMGYLIELSGWAILLQMMAKMGGIYLIVVAIGESIFLLMTFASDALYKTVLVVASNLIGSKNTFLLPKAFQSTLILHGCIVLIFAVPLLLKPEILIHYFTQDHMSINQANNVIYFAKITCFWVWVYFICDGFVWIIAGLLTALKNTIFVMLMNTFAVWFFAIIPVYIIVFKYHADAATIWEMMAMYTFINAICFYFRYKTAQRKLRPNIAGGKAVYSYL
jgi:multidrug resistance protein, MATE family